MSVFACLLVCLFIFEGDNPAYIFWPEVYTWSVPRAMICSPKGGKRHELQSILSIVELHQGRTWDSIYKDCTRAPD